MEQQLNDDSSHYEISLTAGQAFVAFVLLLLSLAASFAFGIMVGRGHGPELAATRQEPSGITEEPAIVEVSDTVPAAPVESTRPETAEREGDDFVIEPARTTETPPRPVEPERPAPPPSTAPVPHFAQLLSTGDQKTAELLAAKLIDDGFTAAYVERTKGEAGMIHRVRVRFPTEADARAAIPKLQGYTTEEIWVTKAQ
jgi:cell division septation protein DedD